MSFLQKAREAASQVATEARQAAGTVADKAQDAETHAKVKAQAAKSAGMARRGMKTVIERIDPATLAELIIKATALQEMANKALREKGSPYRISEITISATIPPGVNFAIGRIDDPEAAAAANLRSSTELLAAAGAADEATIVSLAGEDDVVELAEAAAEDEGNDAEPLP
jgi:hypothetical protein